jgi:hypothetical protein
MTTRHTPGPWKEMDGFIVGGPWADGEFHDICDPRCAPPDGDNTGMINANAQLIAAAPELLAALRDAVEELKHAAYIVNLDEDAIGRAKIAIAKATGEPVMAA